MDDTRTGILKQYITDTSKTRGINLFLFPNDLSQACFFCSDLGSSLTKGKKSLPCI